MNRLPPALLLSLAICTTALAADPFVTVGVRQPKASYQPGEEVVFDIKEAAGQPLESVRWELSRDGSAPITRGTAAIVGGVAEVKGTLDQPGFLRLTVLPAEGKAPAQRAAAVFSPTGIATTQTLPEDFAAFWQAQARAALESYKVGAVTPLASKQEKLSTSDITLETGSKPVRGILSKPKNAAPRSLPAILTLHGAGHRSAAQSTAEGWAGRGMIALDINAHGLANNEPAEYYKAQAKLPENNIRNGKTSREENYFTSMFLRVAIALDYLTQQPEWDGRTLITYGSSQGGAQAIAGAYLDPRVTFVAAGVPAMCEHSGVLTGNPTGWPRFITVGAAGQPKDPKEIETARYLDMVNFARHLEKPEVIFTVGFIDTVCVPSSVYAAWNSIPGDNKQMVHGETHAHTVPPEHALEMRQKLLKHITKQAQPPSGS